MLASELPYDILSLIAQRLSCEDARVCSVVSKSWTLVFREQAFKTLAVFSDTKFKRILNAYACEEYEYLTTNQKDPRYKHQSQNQNQNHTYYPLVQNLEIKHFETNDRQNRTLQHYFQNLRRISVAWNISRVTRTSRETTRWDLWGSLEIIDLRVPRIRESDDLDYVLKTLGALPHLWSFTFECDEIYTAVGWRTIEDLNRHLPGLKHMNICLMLDEIPLQDLLCIEQTVPSTKMTSVGITINQSGPQWFLYLSYKYPNLKHLDWRDSSDYSKMYHDWKTVAPNLMSISSNLSQLQYFNIKTCGTHSNSFHCNFWDVFHYFGLPVKKLVLDAAWDCKLRAEPEDVLAKCMRACSATVESITYSYNYDRHETRMRPVCFNICPRLVTMFLELRESAFTLDSLLDNCPALKDLQLTCKLLLPGESLTSSSRDCLPPAHGLQAITLNRVKTTTKLLNYVSRRCRQLHTMKLIQTNIRGPISQTSGQLDIDMPHTHFKLLKIVSPVFYSYKEEYDYDNMDECATHPVKFLGIEQTDSPDLYTQLDVSCPLVPTKRSLVLFSRELKYMVMKTTSIVLSTDEAQHAFDYFQSFSYRKDSAHNTSIHSLNTYELTEKSFWKVFLFNGYFLLRCKRIDYSVF
ncbi:hypothetical protein F4703DRAFT_1822701, partial [Phycomyces blakesleeanus]